MEKVVKCKCACWLISLLQLFKIINMIQYKMYLILADNYYGTNMYQFSGCLGFLCFNQLPAVFSTASFPSWLTSNSGLKLFHLMFYSKICLNTKVNWLDIIQVKFKAVVVPSAFETFGEHLTKSEWTGLVAC